MADKLYDDDVQHGIDDDPNDDAEKGAALGGIGGAVVGGIAGAMAGPVGAVVGAVAGAAAGAVGSGAAVAAVDNVDNDDTISGIGDGTTRDVDVDTADVTDDLGLRSDNNYGDSPEEGIGDDTPEIGAGRTT
jgi:hypothetical protein